MPAEMGRAGRESGKHFTSGFKELVKGILAIEGVRKIFDFGKESIRGAREQEKAARLTTAAIKSTGGAAKVTGAHITELTKHLSEKVGVDGDAIRSAENLILTFTGIRNEAGKGNKIFDRTSQAVLDMTAALNKGEITSGGLKQSSIQLGKALNDPVKGITALRRVGVSFNASQIETIKGMVASGKTLDAQKLILAEINKEFGGAAEASTNAGQKMAVAWEEFSKQVGTILLPAVNAFDNFMIEHIIPTLSAAADWVGKRLPGALKTFQGIMGPVTHDLGALFDAIFRGRDTDTGDAFFPIIGGALKVRAAVIEIYKLARKGIDDFIGWVGPKMTILAAALTTGTTVGSDQGGVLAWLTRGLADVRAKAMPILNWITGNLVPLLSDLPNTLRTLWNAVSAGTTVGSDQGVLQPRTEALATVRDFVLNDVAPALVTLGQVIFTQLLPAWISWQRNTASQLMPILRQLGAFFLTSVLPALKAVATFIITEVVPRFLEIVGVAKTLIAVVGPIVAQLVATILGKFNEMKPQIMSIWGSVKEIITGVMFIIKAVISDVTRVIQLIWGKWGNQIKAIVGTVFGLIINIIKAALKIVAGIIKFVVALIKGDWRGAWNAIKQIFSGVWDAIKAILSAAWGIIKAKFGAQMAEIKNKWVSWWGNIKSEAKTAMDWVHSKITTVLDKIKSGFASAKTNIKKVWDGIKSVVQAPIDWIRVHVYNKPLVPVWNRIADLVKGPHLQAYASGGVHGVRPGYTPGRDNQLIAVGGGEAIMRPEWTRAVGKDWIDGANRAARTKGARGARDFISGVPAFAGGGIVDWITSKISAGATAIKNLAGTVKGWVLGGLRAAAAKILDPLKSVITSAMPKSGVGNVIGGLGLKAINLILDKIKSSETTAVAKAAATGGPGAPGGPVGGKGYAAALGWARQHKGHPYQFGTLFDCSGFMSALHSIILGQSPHRRYTTTAFHGPHAAGFTRNKRSPFMVGVRPLAGRLGHMAGTLNGVNVESSGGVGVRVGGRARGAGNGMFSWHGGLAKGGVVGDLPFDLLDSRGERYNPELAKLLARGVDLSGLRGLAGGGFVKGGRGGVKTWLGEGRFDELVTPLPKGWKAAMSTPAKDRPITILIDIGDRITERIEGVLDDRDEFHASLGRAR
jgi:phage-related protein